MRPYFVLLLLACPLAAYLLLPRVPDFSVPKRATRLVSVGLWSPVPLAGNMPYQWVTEQQLIVHNMRGVNGILDVNTGSETPIDPLMSALRKSPILAKARVTGLSDWVLSPDGKWLLTYDDNLRPPIWIVVALDGSRVIAFPKRPAHSADAVWDSDSRGFTEIYPGANRRLARRHRFAATGTSHTDGPDFVLEPVANPNRPYFLALGSPQADGILMADLGDVQRRSVPLRLYDVRAPEQGALTPHRDIVVPLPSGAVTSEAEMSPDGRRMAWVFDFEVGLAANPMLRRLPFMPLGPGRGISEVWVSDLDGSHMHPVATADTNPRSTGPSQVRWTPDGRRLTFVYNGALYAARP